MTKRDSALVWVPVRLPAGTKVKYVVAGEGDTIEALEIAGPIRLVDEEPAAAVPQVDRKPSLETRVAALERKAGIA